MIKGYLIDVNNKKSAYVAIENNLETFYQLLNCETIDVIERKINGKFFTIFLDDEGALKTDPTMSAMSVNEILYGNLLIFNSKGEDIADLKDKDADLIKERIFKTLSGTPFVLLGD